MAFRPLFTKDRDMHLLLLLSCDGTEPTATPPQSMANPAEADAERPVETAALLAAGLCQ